MKYLLIRLNSFGEMSIEKQTKNYSDISKYILDNFEEQKEKYQKNGRIDNFFIDGIYKYYIVENKEVKRIK